MDNVGRCSSRLHFSKGYKLQIMKIGSHNIDGHDWASILHLHNVDFIKLFHMFHWLDHCFSSISISCAFNWYYCIFKQRLLLEEFINNLNLISAYCANVEMIFAKVPIVKFFDKISHCDVDININNIVGIKNSFLLRSISLGELLLSLSIIKHWFSNMII